MEDRLTPQDVQARAADGVQPPPGQAEGQARRPALWRRLLPLAVLAVGLVTVFALDLHRYLSFEALAGQRAQLQALVAGQPALMLAGFVAVYALVAALAVPGASLLTVAGGFLFGAWLGTGATVVGATAGATMLFLAARSALGQGLRARAGGVVERVRKGFAENAFLYLLSLRLMPVLPFFLVNLVPAFVGVRLSTYVAATALGILPATFVYSLIGAGLGRTLDAGGTPNLSLLAQPELLAALVGLGLLALVPAVVRSWRGRRAADGAGDLTP